ncbi:MAG TPA: hypothetical protein VIL49_02695 [Capillimicrobium sp.]|jgi:hypothetical protein
MDSDGHLPLPPAVVAAAYLLAALALFVPLSVVGSTFAGAVLIQRGLRQHGLAVIALGVVCAVLAVTVIR